jgi:hypothetical protein
MEGKMEKEVSYLDELMALVEHQRQHDYPVRFEFFVLSGDDQHQIFIHALRKEGPDHETAKPLVKHPNREPLRLWSEDGYIRIVEGSVAKGHGVFRLTPLATELRRA